MNKRRAVVGRENQDLTDFINRLGIGRTYEVINYKELRNLNGDSAVLADVVNALCTLIADLKSKGIIKEK